MYVYKSDSLHNDNFVNTSLKDAEGGRESD